MLSAYYDDSGTHGNSTFVVMACIIGSEAQWTPFEAAWKAQLLEPLPGKPPLRKSHMTDCFNRLREFENYDEAEVDAVTKIFREIILNAGVHGYAVGVPRQEWDQLITGAKRFFLGSVEALCTRFCIMFCAEWAVENSPDKQITIIFDDGPQHVGRSQQISENLKLIHNGAAGRAELFGPSFLPVEKFVPLQAADMFAWESYVYGRELTKDPSKSMRLHFTRFIESNRFEGAFMDKEKIETLASIIFKPR